MEDKLPDKWKMSNDFKQVESRVIYLISVQFNFINYNLSCIQGTSY